MRVSNRILIVSLIAGLIVLCGCLAVFLLSFRTLGAATPPPAAVEATQAPAAESTEAPGEPMPTLVSPPETSIAPQPTPVTVVPALPERRYLTLEFPPHIRAGDADVVRLTLEVDDLGNIVPTAQIGGNVVTGEVIEIPNLYESHHVIAEARFDIAGMEIRPTELISEPLSQGTAATFYWSVRPEAVGVYRGTIWLYLRFVDKTSGEESRKTVSAQLVEIEAVNLLGLSGGWARTAGVVGSVVGTIVGFPFFEDIAKFLFKRRKK